MLQDNEFLKVDEAKPPSRENGTAASASSLPPESPNISFPSSSLPTVQHFLIPTLDGHLKLTASIQQNSSTPEQISSSQQSSHQTIVKLINTSTPQVFPTRTANMHPLETTSPLHQQTLSSLPVALPEITIKQEPPDPFVPSNLNAVHSYSLSSSSSGVLAKDPKLIIKSTLKRHLSNSHVHSDSSVNNSNSVIPISDSNMLKRLKTEENCPTNEIVNSNRNFLIEYYRRDIQNIKREYQDHLTELFFLQSGGNILDYIAFTKHPNSQLIAFLKSNLLDEDDEIFPCDAPIKTEEALPSELQEAIFDPNPKVPNNTPASSPTVRPSQTVKQKSLSPTKLALGRTQSISAVYDSTIGSQEEIVERAKQEAYVMQRISELRKEGLWSSKRLPKVQELPRAKTHWDYLLEEMAWLATDFAQERKWKKNAAKKCAKMVYKYHQDKESKAEREEKEEHQKLRRIASTMAKEVKQFWANIEKVAEYKQQTWLEEKRKKALDLHLNFIVDQTEKFSSWITEGLTAKKEEDTTLSSFDDNDKETLYKRNLDSLVSEEEDSNLSKKLKLSTPDSSDDEQSDITDKLSKDYNDEGHDDDFKVNSEEEDDDETTLLEQEKHEKNTNYKKELKELQELGEMPLEDLYEMYALKAEGSEKSYESASFSESDDDEYESDITDESEDEVEDSKEDTQEPSKDITDIAATAESFQPKGNTLSTTQVQTVVPFLLKHTLREYQHIGLDWLVAMQAKGLNGILADEMGLGKTIQTIALLGHLACDRGVWGPHLIVVPTSVMLNWEMEIKKWCPAFKIITYFGNPKERKKKREGWTKFNAFHICITSYKLVIQDHPSFRRMRWVYFILDEAQHIKNFKSQRWQMLLNFQSSHRLLLTGTPLQNNLMELWSLMHFLMPNVFQSHKEFRDWFANPVTGMIEGNQDYNESLIKRLHKVLRPFLLRRIKSEVEKQLPKKYEHVVMCRLSKRQRYLYDDFMSQTKTKETLASGNFMSVINILMQLRKVCNHPNMFESRPIVSSFMTEGIVCSVPSLILKALSYDPLKHINLWSLNLLLTEIELRLSAFAAHSIQKYKTPERLILDITPPPPAPPPIPAGKIKLHVRTGERPLPSSPIQQQQKIVVVSPRAASPPPPRPEYSLHLLQTSQPATSGVSLAQLTSSNPITVQIQQSGGGAKLSLPLGIGRVVQTTSGQHILLTPLGDNLTTVAQPGISSGQTAMVVTSNITSSPISTLTTSAFPSSDYLKKKNIPENSKSSDSVLERINQKKQSVLMTRHQLLAHVNRFRCGAFPTYGSDLISAVTIRHSSNSCARFASYGHLNCKQAHCTDDYWSTTHCLQDIIVPNPESYLTRLMPIITRYVFVVPPVTSPPVQLHAHHHQSSNIQKYEEKKLFWELSQRSAFLHPIISNTRTQFPELRLIQYDCGKLQTLDKLLWQLKQENHRVLIFTQMTRMLDIMEQFLNYHGHTYLRLDGATRVEQRQIMMERFNADKRIFCFILSTRSGGIGVNLTGADTVIFYDSDWNPTMDAQAQDRCHRIGQTRDVHIYRLVSRKTVEENILKKANQKRLLGNLAIEGGNFTTAFFKNDTIRDLFDVDLEEEQAEHAKDSSKEASIDEPPPEKFTQQQLEQALGMAEEESDLQAATTARAEAAAELAEFDESIPLEGNASEADGDKTQAEEELDKIVDQLTPVERYALRFLESIHEPFSQEQLKQAEEEIEAQKKDWELGRLKAIKEEEERLAAANMMGPDDPFLTMVRADDTPQEYMHQNEVMPMWTPPTPPQEEEDESSFYSDDSLGFLYEPTPMPESLLPPLFIKKENKKHKALPVSVNRKQKVRCKEETVHIPRSLFDRPSAAILKMRKEVKLQKVRSLMFSKQGASPGPTLKTGGLMVGNKPASTILDQDSPEWLIHEDWTILQVIQEYQQLPLNLVIVSPAHTPNWDLVADCLGGIRSPRQARARYENVILPREEGRLLYDARKHKKCKSGIYKTKNTRPMRTSQLYLQDNNSSFTSLYCGRFDMIRSLSNKRFPTLRRWPGNSKSVAKSCILAESGIVYDQPLSPIQVALIRAERIARDKQNKQNAANAAQMPPVVSEGPAPVPKPTPPPTVAQIAAAALPQQSQQPVANISPAVIATLQNIAKNAKPLTQGMVVTTTSAVPVTIVASETVAVTTNAAQQLTAGTQRIAAVPAQLPAALRQQSASRNLTASQAQAYRQQTTILRASQQRLLQEQQLKRFQQQQQHTVTAANTKLNAPRVTHSDVEMQLIKRQQPQQQFTTGHLLAAATSQTLQQGTATLVKSGGNQPVAIPVSAVNISLQQPAKGNKNQMTAAMSHQIRHLQLQPHHIFRPKGPITKSQMGTVQIMQPTTSMTGNKTVMQQIIKQVVPIPVSSATGAGELAGTRVISVAAAQQAQTTTLKQIQVVTAPLPSSSTTPTLATLTTGGDKLAGQAGTIVLDTSEDGKKIASTPHTLRLRKP